MDLDDQIEQLVRRSQGGDRSAFESLVECYHARLKYFVRRLDGTDDRAEDYLQEIWLIAFKKIRKLKKPGSFPVWLYRIARHRVYRSLRRREPILPLPGEKALPDPKNPEPVFNRFDAEKVHKALSTLKPFHREVLTLYFLEQMSYQDIAQVTGCRIGTVRSRLFYAKLSLREKLESGND